MERTAAPHWRSCCCTQTYAAKAWEHTLWSLGVAVPVRSSRLALRGVLLSVLRLLLLLLGRRRLRVLVVLLVRGLLLGAGPGCTLPMVLLAPCWPQSQYWLFERAVLRCLPTEMLKRVPARQGIAAFACCMHTASIRSQMR